MYLREETGSPKSLREELPVSSRGGLFAGASVRLEGEQDQGPTTVWCERGGALPDSGQRGALPWPLHFFATGHRHDGPFDTSSLLDALTGGLGASR